MESGEIVLLIILILSCIFCMLIVIDKALFVQKTRNILMGMTGKEIQDNFNLKIYFLSIEGDTYYALIRSKLTIFKMRLVFVNGKLLAKQRM